jgi:hypothetical protein
MSLTPTFQGEVQMRRWSDSSTQGVQVTFALPDASDLEPLKAKAGKRFMAVLVEIGDDEQPIQAPRKDTRGPLCREAQELCKSPEFQKWSARMMTPDDGVQWEPSESLARRYVLEACEVGSRSDFDADAGAADRFIRTIRLPFMKRRKQ